METTIINIPCSIDKELLLKNLHLKATSPFFKKAEGMIDQALAVGKPKSVYKLAYIESKGDDFVVIGGIKFTSRVLRVNLEEAFKVVPYVITCGEELQEWAKTFNDMLDVYYADEILQGVLRSARQSVFLQIDEEFRLGHSVNMNPGSLPNWPINEQKPLFQLLGNVKDMIGVELKDSFLMNPIKSVSGFRFSKEGSYENCQLCPREKCPGRKAAYDKNLYEEKYRQK